MVLAGRDAQLARVEAMLTRVHNSGEASPAHMFVGTRGLGKTVTLSVSGDRAIERGYLVAGVSMDRVSDNIQMLATTLAECVAPLNHPETSTVWARIRHRLAALSIEVNAGVVKIVSPPAPESAPHHSTVQRQVLAALLADAARAARERGQAGLVVLLDELQEAPAAQLVVLANAIQDAAAMPQAPLCVIGAGLPQTPDLVTAAASFTERFDFRVLGRLVPTDAERALIEPALSLGVRWEPDAAAEALRAAGGSPYLIQYVGDETWARADPHSGTTLTRVDLAGALDQVRENLDAGTFRGRWSKATPGEKAVIVAIADVVDESGVAATRDVSAWLGVESRGWSMARQSLLDKGIIEPVARGRLRFTMPGFGAFVAGQVPRDEPDPDQRRAVRNRPSRHDGQH